MGILKKFVVLLTVAFSSIAFASGKIVVLDPQEAILSTNAAKKRIEEFKTNAEFAEMLAKYESLKVDLQGLAKDAEKNGMTWSQEQQADYRKKMEYKRADFELAAKKLQAEEKAAMSRIMQEFAPKVQEALKQIIAAEAIGMVLNSQAVYHVDDAFNITAKVTDKLNKTK